MMTSYMNSPFPGFSLTWFSTTRQVQELRNEMWTVTWNIVRLRVPTSFGRCKEYRHRQRTWINARAELESERDRPAHLAQQLQVSFSFALILFLVAAVLLLLPCYILAHRYYSFAFFLSVCVATVQLVSSSCGTVIPVGRPPIIFPGLGYC